MATQNQGPVRRTTSGWQGLQHHKARTWTQQGQGFEVKFEIYYMSLTLPRTSLRPPPCTQFHTTRRALWAEAPGWAGSPGRRQEPLSAAFPTHSHFSSFAWNVSPRAGIPGLARGGRAAQRPSQSSDREWALTALAWGYGPPLCVEITVR